MAATGITAVKNALVAKIAAWWEPAEPDQVFGKGRVDEVISESVGRKVYVFRGGRTNAPVNRIEDQNDYAFVIWVVERYADDGDPPEEWLDERIAWVETLFDLLGDSRGPKLLATDGDPNSGLWPQECVLATAYDVEDFTQYKTFSSVINVTYREQTN